MERSQLQMINAAGGHINRSKDANTLFLYFIFYFIRRTKFHHFHGFSSWEIGDKRREAIIQRRYGRMFVCIPNSWLMTNKKNKIKKPKKEDKH
jgi:hypothetical protein